MAHSDTHTKTTSDALTVLSAEYVHELWREKDIGKGDELVGRSGNDHQYSLNELIENSGCFFTEILKAVNILIEYLARNKLR